MRYVNSVVIALLLLCTLPTQVVHGSSAQDLRLQYGLEGLPVSIYWSVELMQLGIYNTTNASTGERYYTSMVGQKVLIGDEVVRSKCSTSLITSEYRYVFYCPTDSISLNGGSLQADLGGGQSDGVIYIPVATLEIVRQQYSQTQSDYYIDLAYSSAYADVATVVLSRHYGNLVPARFQMASLCLMGTHLATDYRLSESHVASAANLALSWKGQGATYAAYSSDSNRALIIGLNGSPSTCLRSYW